MTSHNQWWCLRPFRAEWCPNWLVHTSVALLHVSDYMFLLVYSTWVCFGASSNQPSIPFILCLQRYIAFEDSQDGEKKDLQCRLLTLESHTRQLDLKIKNYADQSKSILLFFICHEHGLHQAESIIANESKRQPREQHRQLLWPYVAWSARGQIARVEDKGQ